LKQLQLELSFGLMTALSADRDTPMREQPRDPNYLTPEVHPGVVIWAGAIVVLEHGQAVPARSAVGLTVLGVARSSIDNRTYPIATGGRRRRVIVVAGVAQFENSTGGDQIRPEDSGAVCFLVDDRTLARTDGGGKRSPAGTVEHVDDDQRVWVDLGASPVARSVAP
jgi:hypothetical protein